MVRRRLCVTPNGERSAEATVSAVGNRWVIASSPVSMGVPSSSTSRPEVVVAPATLTCWPRIALTPSSNPS